MHFYAVSEESLLNNTKAMGLLTLSILITLEPLMSPNS